MLSLAIFSLASLPIVWVSRQSLLRPRSHGFPRFFAFETILAIVVVNAPHWFVDPLGARQLVAWLLLSLSLVFIVSAVMLLRRHGASEPAPHGAPEFDWENTQRLITTGVYRYVRHPMYASLLFLAWGALLKAVTPTTLALAVLASIALAATAVTEEVEDLQRFGQPYRDYMEHTRRFVPFLL